MRKKFLHILFMAAAALLLSCGQESLTGKRTHIAMHIDSTSIIKYSPRELCIIHDLDSIFACRIREACFNGCVLVARKGRIIYTKAMGFADYREKKILNLNSSFQLASASKPFTATAVLLLKDQGMLSLDDSIQKYIPGFPYKGVTVRYLLCHRSGLPNYMYFAENYFGEDSRLLSNQDIVDCMIQNKPAGDFPPGKKFEYCNTNYCLLACIIEKVSGKSYAAFMQENIFGPLGMSRSFVLDRLHDTIRLEHTKGYEGKKWEDAEVNMLDGVLGDKNIYSTVHDMFLFDRALYSGRLLKPGTLAEAYRGYSHEHPGKRNYGLGWRMIEKEGGDKVIYHNGWWHGYNSLFYRRLSDETLIVMLCNHNNRSTYHIQDILEVLDNDTLGTELEE